MKTRGYALRHRRIRQHIPRQLLDRELVERHAVIDRFDHPVPIGPDGTRTILLVAVRIRVTSDIQPLAPPALTVVFRIQQTVHHLFIGILGLVIHESVRFLRCRRQSDQVQVNPLDQRVSIGRRARLHAFLVETCHDELIDLVLRPVRIRNLRRRRLPRTDESPMLLISRTFRNPLPQFGDLRLTQLPLGLGWRHSVTCIRRQDSFQQFAVKWLAGNNCARINRPSPLVETQTRLPRVLVRPMTIKTLARQNRTNVVVERNLRRSIHRDDRHPGNKHTNSVPASRSMAA